MPWVVLRFALILVALSVSPAPHALAQDKPWRIGFLSGGLPQVPDKPGDLAAFQQGLDGLGYQEGRNYVIEDRVADTDASRLPALAKELVERRVDVIVTIGTQQSAPPKKRLPPSLSSWPGATTRSGMVLSPAWRVLAET